jgi:hypothetical protein
MKSAANIDAANPEDSRCREIMSDRSIDRRDFIQRVAVVSAAAGTGLAGFTSTTELKPASKSAPQPAKTTTPFVGIQMGPHTMLDEGIERCLDLVQETAAVNAVMPYSHGYNNAFLKALRDRAQHGVPLTDNSGRKFPLVWVKTHEQFYQNTTLRHQPVDATFEHANRDLFAELVGPCRKRGLKSTRAFWRLAVQRSRISTKSSRAISTAIRPAPRAGIIRSTSASGRTRWKICFAVTISLASNGAPSGRDRS